MSGREIPIIFSAPMVRAILDGRKTQTRRIAGRGRIPKPGDLLWVRETWAWKWTDGVGEHLVYRADGEQDRAWLRDGRWRPAIHMPRSTSRLILAVRELRYEPLRSISWADALAEGIQGGGGGSKTYGVDECLDKTPMAAFARLWDAINGARSPWRDNSTVRVIRFEVLA